MPPSTSMRKLVPVATRIARADASRSIDPSTNG
jgi:hypothetical protein